MENENYRIVSKGHLRLDDERATFECEDAAGPSLMDYMRRGDIVTFMTETGSEIEPPFEGTAFLCVREKQVQ